jgi:hypothetical protein
MKEEALVRKPMGILLSVLCLSLFPLVTIPVKAQSPERLNYLGFGGAITPGLAGAQLVREGQLDIYAHNYSAAIPLLEKGVRLGNAQAMWYLGKCYEFGIGVPVDLARARQLTRPAM